MDEAQGAVVRGGVGGVVITVNRQPAGRALGDANGVGVSICGSVRGVGRLRAGEAQDVGQGGARAGGRRRAVGGRELGADRDGCGGKTRGAIMGDSTWSAFSHQGRADDLGVDRGKVRPLHACDDAHKQARLQALD